jgi:flagellar biosynthesis protein FlhA
MALDPPLEQLLHNVVQQSNPQVGVVLDPGLSERLFTAIRQATHDMEVQGFAPVLVVSPAVRPWLARSCRHRAANLAVLSYGEIPDEQAVKVVQTISADAPGRLS